MTEMRLPYRAGVLAKFVDDVESQIAAHLGCEPTDRRFRLAYARIVEAFFDLGYMPLDEIDVPALVRKCCLVRLRR
jgi:hypothetical protein